MFTIKSLGSQIIQVFLVGSKSKDPNRLYIPDAERL